MRNPNHLEYIKALYSINTSVNTSIEYKNVKRQIDENGIGAQFSDACLDKEQAEAINDLLHSIEILKKLKGMEYENSGVVLDSLIYKYNKLEQKFNESFNKHKTHITEDISRQQKIDYECAVDYLNSGDAKKTKKAIEILESLDPDYMDVKKLLLSARKKYQTLNSKKTLKTVLALCCVIVLGFGVYFAFQNYFPKINISSNNTDVQRNTVTIFETDFSLPAEWLLEKSGDGSVVTVYFGDKNKCQETKEYMELTVIPGLFKEPFTYESATVCLADYRGGNIDTKFTKTPILSVYYKDEGRYVYVMMINEHDAVRIDYIHDKELSEKSHSSEINDFIRTAVFSYGSLPRAS